MRAATSALVNYINILRAEPDAQSIVADCYTFTLLTGLILTYTNADVPVTLNGYVYAANSILVDGLKFKCAAGLEVDQQQITVSARATDTVGGVPFLQALRNGVFDGCEIQRERAFQSAADTANPIGSVILFKGRIGTVDNVGRTSAQITVNSDLVLLDLQMPRNVYAPACQHVLYDSGCTLIKSAFGTAGQLEPVRQVRSSTGPAPRRTSTRGQLRSHRGSMRGLPRTSKAQWPEAGRRRKRPHGSGAHANWMQLTGIVTFDVSFNTGIQYSLGGAEGYQTDADMSMPNPNLSNNVIIAVPNYSGALAS
jgi:hypothetical protein